MTLVSTIVVLLLVAAQLGRWNRPRLCINSSVVERVDIIGRGMSTRLMTCQVGLEAEPTAIGYRKWIDLVENSTQEVAPLLMIAGLHGDAPVVKLHFDRPLLWKIHPYRIDIGIDQLEAKGQMTRALLAAYLLQVANPSLARSDLALETLVDLVLVAIKGELNVDDPISGLRLPIEDSPSILGAIRTATTIDSLCQSPWHLSSQSEDCGENAATKTIAPIAVQSLRPVLVSRAATVLRTIPLGERRRELLGLIRRASVFNWDELASINSHSGNLGTIEALLGAADKVESYGLAFGPYEPGKKGSVEVDIMIELDESTFSKLPSLGNQIDILNNRLRYGERKIILKRSDGKIAASTDGPWLAYREKFWSPKKRVMIASQTPMVGRVLQTKSVDGRVLVINTSNLENLRLLPLIYGGIRWFALANPQVRFQVYHQPSLLDAAKRGLALSTRLEPRAGGKGLTKKWSHLLGLDQVQFHEDSKSYSIAGPLPALEWFRNN